MKDSNLYLGLDVHQKTVSVYEVLFYGAYANRVRASCRDDANANGEPDDDSKPQRRHLRKRWAELIHRIYEVDPLTGK